MIFSSFLLISADVHLYSLEMFSTKFRAGIGGGHLSSIGFLFNLLKILWEICSQSGYQLLIASCHFKIPKFVCLCFPCNITTCGLRDQVSHIILTFKVKSACFQAVTHVWAPIIFLQQAKFILSDAFSPIYGIGVVCSILCC